MDINTLIDLQRQYFNTGATKSYEFRVNNLKKLRKLIIDGEEDILACLEADLSKSNFESFISEYGVVLEEIDFAIKNLKKWMKKHRVRSNLLSLGNKSFYVYEPMGVNLLISPWNYPFNLTLAPLVGMIASGNTVIIKTSSKSKATSNFINKLINDNFSPEYMYHCDNESLDYDSLIKGNYDHITYTGGPEVAKKIMKNQASNLTKLTLELGGKSPCLVEKTADIDLAAKKIAWGKTLNAGQTCIAPDYIIIDEEIEDDFIKSLKIHLENFFGKNPLLSKDLPKIINEEHFARILGLIDEKKVIYGGSSDKNNLKISPTIMYDVDFTDKVMGEEIFGPILPIISYNNLDTILAKIKRMPKPLAFYCFTRDKEIEEKIINQMEYGNGAINDCLMQVSNPRLEFGGVGNSGMGGYHGYFGFMNFSNRKSISKAGIIDNFLKYPPYGQKQFALIKKFIK